MGIDEFLQRCDVFRASTGVSDDWLSRRLFWNDGKKLTTLRDGTADIGVKRLAVALEALAELEAGRDPRETMPPPPPRKRKPVGETGAAA